MKHFPLIFSCIAVLFCACIFAFPLADCLEYQRVCDSAIVVEAVVSKHAVKDEFGLEQSYDSRITYTVNGTTYKNILYERNVSRRSKLTPMDSRVTVAVNPENPGELLEHIIYPSEAFTLSLPLMAALAWLLQNLRRLRLSKNVDGKPDGDTVTRDLKIVLASRFLRVFFLLDVLSALLLYFLFPAVFSWGILIVAGLFLVPWLIFLGFTLRDAARIGKGDFLIRRELLVRKEKVKSGNGFKCFLYYSGPEKEWRAPVLPAVYRRAVENSPVHAVYLEGFGRPLLYYDCDGNANAQFSFPTKAPLK